MKKASKQCISSGCNTKHQIQELSSTVLMSFFFWEFWRFQVVISLCKCFLEPCLCYSKNFALLLFKFPPFSFICYNNYAHWACICMHRHKHIYTHMCTHTHTHTETCVDDKFPSHNCLSLMKFNLTFSMPIVSIQWNYLGGKRINFC